MTPITLPRATVEQALKALEGAAECVQQNYLPDKCGHDWDEQITALRAALAQQAEPWERRVALAEQLQMQQTEPTVPSDCADSHQPAQAEPVAWAFRHSDGTYHDPSVTEHSAGMVPLYTAPPQRKPLTDEEIDAVWDQWFGAYGLRGPSGPYTRRGFARAVERALEEKNRGR